MKGQLKKTIISLSILCGLCANFSTASASTHKAPLMGQALYGNLKLKGATWTYVQEKTWLVAWGKKVGGGHHYYVGLSGFYGSNGSQYYLEKVVELDNNNSFTGAVLAFNHRVFQNAGELQKYFYSIGGTQRQWNNYVMWGLV